MTRTMPVRSGPTSGFGFASHYDIVLPDLSDETLSRLEECFDHPVPNPGRA